MYPIFYKFSWKKNMSLELIPILIGLIQNGIPPIPIRQNDADPTQSSSGYTTLALPIKQLSKSFSVGLG